jgi:hypothetical protein
VCDTDHKYTSKVFAVMSSHPSPIHKRFSWCLTATSIEVNNRSCCICSNIYGHSSWHFAGNLNSCRSSHAFQQGLTSLCMQDAKSHAMLGDLSLPGIRLPGREMEVIARRRKIRIERCFLRRKLFFNRSSTLKYINSNCQSTRHVSRILKCCRAAEPDAIERDQEECGYKLHGQAGAWV